MLSAWRDIFKIADFSVQPIWRAPKRMPLPAVARFDAPNKPVKMEVWEFRQRYIYDERERRRGKMVYGRLSTSDDWQPLTPLPRYVTVGDWA